MHNFSFKMHQKLFGGWALLREVAVILQALKQDLGKGRKGKEKGKDGEERSPTQVISNSHCQ